MINRVAHQLKFSKRKSTQKINLQTYLKSKALFYNIKKLIEQIIYTI